MANKLEALPTAANIDLDPRLFNKVYMPWIFGENKKIHIYPYNVLYGGSGAGKSFAIGDCIAIQMTILPGRNCVCLRKQKTDCIESCWAFVYNSLRKFKLLRFWNIRTNPDHRMINRINGNEILFEGVDNIEDIKSIQFTKKDDFEGGGNLTDVWYEEVNAEDDPEVIREIDRRLRDPFVNTRIILSFNPVSRTHFLFDLVTKEWRMDGVDSFILKTTYKDNRFLPASYGEKLERLKYTDPYAYNVYALGNWGTTGETVFNANKIAQRLSILADIHAKTPPIKVYFTYEMDEKGSPNMDSCREIAGSSGEATIYVQPNPKHPYVAALDTAGEGEDCYFMQVFDNITDEQVATFKSDRLADHCMPQVYGLLKKYNNALFAPEVNFSEYPILKMKEWQYMNIYQREKPASSRSDGYEQKLGFRTTSGNRQSILDNLIEWAELNYDKINDTDTLNEMLTFTRQVKKNKGIFMGAEPGAHDDAIISLAIMLQAKEQQVCYEIPEMQHIEGYWTLGELNLALADNRVSLDAVREYKEIYSHRFERKERRVNRYAR